MVKIQFPTLNDTIKGVLCDLDGTLYSHDEAHRGGVDQLYRDGFTQLPREDFEAFYQKARKKVQSQLYPTGVCRSRTLYIKNLCEEVFSVAPYNKVLSCVESYWRGFFAEMKLYEGAREFLQECQDRSVRICVITNFDTSPQIEKLQRLGVIDYVDHLVTSEEVGVEKPHESIFQFALNKMKIDKEFVLMVGDNPQMDIEGAQNFGLKTFQVVVS